MAPLTTLRMGLSLLCLLTSAELRNDSKLLPPKGLLQYSNMYYICMLSKWSILNWLLLAEKDWKIIFFFWLTLLVACVRRLQPTQVGPFQKALHLSDHLMSRKKTGSQKRCVQQQLGSIWSCIVIYAYVIYFKKTYNTYKYTHNQS